MRDPPMQPFAAVRRRSRRLAVGLPADLIVVAGFVAVATALLTVVDVSSPLARAAVGFPLLFLVPGYVTVSALFPRAPAARESRRSSGTATGRTDGNRRARAVTDVERAALSFGLSFALLPLLGLGIAASPWTFTRPAIVSTVACFALIGVGLATARRLSVPAGDRYRLGFGRRLATARAAIFGAESTLQVAINVVLVVSMLLALTTVGYALVAPQDGEQYTGLQLLTESESGQLVASGYPETIEPDESIPLVIAVENQEGTDESYTVVVQEQRIEDGDVVERTELQRIDYSVSDGRTVYGDREIDPEAESGTTRIAVLLYDDGVPETPTLENAYRDTSFSVDVTDDAGEDATAVVGDEDDDAADADDDGGDDDEDADGEGGDDDDGDDADDDDEGGDDDDDDEADDDTDGDDEDDDGDDDE